ncbi:peptidase S8 and S53 [Arthroderma uncinatum]|uniref:peptidase S8 and S53 n=1 Tax=Arthroderma uncinatum TaxID=74035 RepID=UPI00144ADC8B|nr:peptidase S8 and S53 [Arthroderma uncinatum]XP_033403952.1 peptidase S8 and S53 [Arthroderma uncinatum]KAF3479404.1 peptidase S8 and S53 [Arthroderma uncinatum]KAF3480044.1 peptidase S8 and S53 [Arthroderma uncinatum]
MSLISINGNDLNPQSQRPVLQALGMESEDSSKSNYILIQTKELLEDDQEDELERLGVDIQEYVSFKTYLCSYKPADLAAIRSLPFVAWANVYLDMFVIQSAMKSVPPSTNALAAFSGTVPRSSRRRTVDIVLHNDVDSTSQELHDALGMATRAATSCFRVGPKKIRMIIEEQHMDEVAAIDDVRSIHEVHPAVLFNNKAVPIIKGEVDTSSDAPIGTMEAKTEALPYTGEGEIVAVGDTGFDKGSTTDTHPAFTGRVKHLYALGRTNPATADDPNGHGTHVCGSVLGDGVSEKMGGKIQGTAPKATLVLQSLLDSNNGLGGIPDDLTNLFIQPYKDHGARIHTNSWGSNSPSGQLPYDSSSEEIDRFVWDHQDMVILFAAGNAGADADQDGSNDKNQIGSQAAAKNCITVGASENDRPDIAVTYAPWFPNKPYNDDRVADHPNGMAAFSSRGPTKEGRIKPDVVAPGTSILSTRSSKLLKPSTTFGTSTDPAWFFNGGTSMATPLVAGGVALIRQALVKNGTKDPSAALIKAMLINGAVELPGQYVPSEAGPSPNISSGYGRVHVKNSISLPNEESAGYREGGPLTQGKTDSELVIKVPKKAEGSSTLKVTLVWSDPPGATLQNDLDLIVTASDGTERHGNMGSKKDFDRSNNVEQVVWTKIPSGDVKVQVRAFHIFKKQFAQRFAVAWSIDKPLK